MIGAQYLHYTGRCIYRHRTLLHHNLIALRDAGNHARCVLDVFEVGRPANAVTKGFRGCIDGDEDELSLFDGRLDVRGKEEVHVAALFDDSIEARLNG